MPFEVTEKLDYKNGINSLPKSDVLKFILPNGWISVQLSGTEPKIKFYYEVFAKTQDEAKKQIQKYSEMITSM